MFNDIPLSVAEQMHQLEIMDVRDRADGTPRTERLRQITPEVGRLIALLAAAAPPGQYLEVGTSGGYSTLWLAIACREVNRKVITFEILEEKAELAQRTFKAACVTDVVELVLGDALIHLPNFRNIAFCFLDAEKEIYYSCYESVVSRMVSGGILIADNAISHRVELQPMLDLVMTDDRVDAMIVPIGRGELLCRRK